MPASFAAFKFFVCHTLVLSCTVAGFTHNTAHHDVHTRTDDVSPLEAIVMKQGQLIAQMQARIDALEAKQVNDERLVAFMVSVPQTQVLSNEQRVHFGTPELNAGGGFHTSTNSFVAPVSGLYVFFLKVMGQAGGDDAHYMKFTLKKDNAVIAETETNDDDNQDRSSVQVVVDLKQGQSVWVEKSGGSGTTISGGGILSTLGGFLLRAGDTF
ncbi:complement C1q tumor necrosis factor-related protein 3-like [Littorina saxatilis]|uniref:C1q domain-containing protein n=1 Tax=Littorina saxatilis TaxID=31220 RepID=A0AAN9GL48_9CAEN